MNAMQLWLVLTKNSSIDRRPLRSAHQKYMAGLVEGGVIFASGPTAPDVNAPFNGGITILQVSDREQAKRIMDAEPYINGGARTYELISWKIVHGIFATEPS